MYGRYDRLNVFFEGRDGICHVRALVPRTTKLRRQGLRGLTHLPRGAAMVFPFHNDKAALTMTGMSFPIDIAFVRKGWLVKWVTAAPGEAVIAGPEGADMAIELPARYLSAQGIEPGTAVRVRS